MQPSADSLQIGNYIGALLQWRDLQESYDAFFSVVDLHALTQPNDPAELREKTRRTAAQYIAAGIEPSKSTLYVQSHVPAHAELAWILGTLTGFGEAGRMTQFKDKSSRYGQDATSVGLFTYPVLMAADILLYQTNLVPIGEDQRQHLEICRDIAIRFNNAYSPTFAVPEAYIPKVGARVMSLQEPTAKMSKSDENQDNFVAILDPPDVIMKKFKRAMTDSETEVRFDVAAKPGVSNLMSIYGAMTGKDMKTVEKEFVGRGYGDFKEAVGVSVVEGLRPVQDKYALLMADTGAIEAMLARSADRAEHVARKTLSKVMRKIGFLPRGGSK
jgi:tryptophanyl-tRNA synthetase